MNADVLAALRARYRDLANREIRQGRYRRAAYLFAEAIADYDRALQLSPHQAKAYYNHGTSKLDLEDLDGAAEDFSKAIDEQAGFPEPWAARGWARKQKGEREGAVSDLKRFLELAPGHPMPPRRASG